MSCVLGDPAKVLPLCRRLSGQPTDSDACCQFNSYCAVTTAFEGCRHHVKAYAACVPQPIKIDKSAGRLVAQLDWVLRWRSELRSHFFYEEEEGF